MPKINQRLMKHQTTFMTVIYLTRRATTRQERLGRPGLNEDGHDGNESELGIPELHSYSIYLKG